MILFKIIFQSNRYYSTKFAAPKKVEKDKKLSANIQKFLQKKEEEEKEKSRKAAEDLKELLAKRSEKDKNKIRKMLKVTKSANKSVLDDAIDANDTAITLAGPEQPDEDDYGYTSQEASQLYRKLMDKYKTDPEEDKKGFSKSKRKIKLIKKKCKLTFFSFFLGKNPKAIADLSSTKDRVKAAIQRAQEEEAMPHRRQRQATEKTESTTASSEQSDEIKHRHRKKNLYDPEAERLAEEERKKEEMRARIKSKKPPPPAMDFRQLLQLAEQKQFEPLEVEVETKPKEPERLLTNREKREIEERKQYLAEREKRKLNGKVKTSTATSVGKPEPTKTDGKMLPNGRIPKLNSNSDKSQSSNKSLSHGHSNGMTSRLTEDAKRMGSNSTVTSKSSALPSAKPAPTSTKSTAVRSEFDDNKHRSSSSSKPMSSSSQAKPPTATSNAKVSTKSNPSTTREFPPKDVIRKPVSSSGATREYPPKDVIRKPGTSSGGTREFPPKDIIRKPAASSASTREFPPKDVIRKPATSSATTREFPPKDVIRKPTTTTSSKASAATSKSASSKSATPTSSSAQQKTRPFPPYDTKKTSAPAQKTRPFPPPYGNERSRQFPPSDVRRDAKRPPAKRKLKLYASKKYYSFLFLFCFVFTGPIIDDDDSEYDSEMDDFIDDGPEEGDYSKYIKEIFGYDRAR